MLLKYHFTTILNLREITNYCHVHETNKTVLRITGNGMVISRPTSILKAGHLVMINKEIPPHLQH